MKAASAPLKWFQFRQRFIDWREKRHNDQLATLDHVEERSIRIVQKRYGYTKEQAAIEFDKHYSKVRLG